MKLEDGEGLVLSGHRVSAATSDPALLKHIHKYIQRKNLGAIYENSYFKNK